MLTQATCLQQALDTLTELFDCLGLCTNVTKMVSMACQTFRVLGGHSLGSYGLQMTGKGQTYQDQLIQRF